MNNLTVFKNDEFKEVRTLMINDEPWFVGKDVAEYFGDTNYRRSLARLDEDDKGVSQIDTPGGSQNMVIINESGLYSLLFCMQPQHAMRMSQDETLINERIDKIKKFKRWITSEVLPSIRKTGQYQIGPIKPPTVTEMIRLGKFIKGLMDDQKATPYQTAEAIMETLKNCGLNVSDKLSLPVKLEKLKDDELDMVDFATTFPKSTYQDYLLYRTIMMNSRGK